MAIEDLFKIPRLKVISSGEEIPTTGNSPVKVITEDYEMYLAKNSKSLQPATDIINELLAHYFLKIWGLHTPDAAILDFPKEMLQPHYSKHHHKPQFYDRPLFGSKWIEGALDTAKYFGIKSKFDLRNLENPQDIFKIGLFDIWVENDDRKPTNLNLMLHENKNGKLDFIPIDHCFIFSTMKYQDIKPEHFCPVANENLLVTDLAKSLKKYKHENRNWDKDDKDYFYLCISECEKYFDDIIRYIPEQWGFTDEDASSLKNFLFSEERNKAVFIDYLEKTS